MSDGYAIRNFRGKFCIVWYDAGGKRHRHSLDTIDASEAKRLAPSVYAELTRPKGKSVAELWEAYCVDKAGRRTVSNMRWSWKALGDRFGPMAGDAITLQDCRAHTAERRKAGIKDGSIWTELGHLRVVLNWAQRNRLCQASPIERPPQPPPSEEYLTREQTRALMNAAELPHIKLYVILAMATGARNEALLELTWDRCNFERAEIDLRKSVEGAPRKGRAIIPMNRPLKAALIESHKGALSEHVIEWAGERVLSVKKALKSAAKRAGIAHISPHMLRHSAAVHMAEDGISMDEIAQYLGHRDVSVTRRIYARYSPDYLRRAAASLEYDDVAEARRKKEVLSGSMNRKA